jgi:hypothetical protein
MKKYEVSEMRRIRDYTNLFSLLTQYHARQFNYSHDGKEGTLSFAIPKANAENMDKGLKESGLVFRVLE